MMAMDCHSMILLMEEILHQLIWRISNFLQGFIHPRWCRISSINSTLTVYDSTSYSKHDSVPKSLAAIHFFRLFAYNKRAQGSWLLYRPQADAVLRRGLFWEGTGQTTSKDRVFMSLSICRDAFLMLLQAS